MTVEIQFTLCTPQTPLKGRSVRCFFRFLHPIKDIKKIFHIPIFTELEPDLTHLAHKGNTQSDFFLCDRLKIFIAFCSLGALPLIISSLPWLKC